MSFSLSPVISVKETDLTNIIPAVAVANGATVIQAQWGPVKEIKIVSGENFLADNFGRPTNTTYKDFMAAASFLAYARNLRVVRVVGTDAMNASNGTAILIENDTDYENTVFSDQTFVARFPGALGNSIGVAWADATEYDNTDSNGDYTWIWRAAFDNAPESNEYHFVTYDADGSITGEAGTLLEKFDNLSTVEGSKKLDGSNAYWPVVINRASKWLRVGDETNLGASNNGTTLAGGSDGTAVSDADYQAGWAMFQDPEKVDINLCIVGGASPLTAKWVIDNVAERRRDCVAFVSPAMSDTVGITDYTTILENILTTRKSYGSSSYAFMDGAWKQMYDRYNDVMRWVPLNGDMAGLFARTAFENDPWWSFAGYNRGRIKNIVMFSWEPGKTFRDELFKNNVNPLVFDPNDGPVLLGDKTLQAKASAFDAINVRMLFIVMEKAISTASKYFLFEFNDRFTRNRFINMVEPYLRDIQGRRGVTGFRVICDETNNTPEVIDRNEFIGTIAVKPNRAIRNITLNFVATRTGVSFDELFG